MREIRKRVPKAVSLIGTEQKTRSRHINFCLSSWSTTNEPIYRLELNPNPVDHGTRHGVTITQLNQLRLLASDKLSQFDITTAYANDKDIKYQARTILHQCMNAIQIPTETTPQKRGLQVKIKVAVRTTQRKRGKFNFFPS
jgi:hypothetical protein